jgi:hypothetical protein
LAGQVAAARRAVELSHRIETTGHRAASRMLGQMLGTAYEQGAFMPDGTGPPDVADAVAGYVPTARRLTASGLDVIILEA